MKKQALTVIFIALIVIILSTSISAAVLDKSAWEIGTLASASGQYNANQTRIYTPEYYESDKTAFEYTGGEDYHWICMSYDKDKTYLGTSDWIQTKTYVNLYPNTVYYRFIIRYADGKAIDDIAKVSSVLTITVADPPAPETTAAIKETTTPVVTSSPKTFDFTPILFGFVVFTSITCAILIKKRCVR